MEGGGAREGEWLAFGEEKRREEKLGDDDDDEGFFSAEIPPGRCCWSCEGTSAETFILSCVIGATPIRKWGFMARAFLSIAV